MSEAAGHSEPPGRTGLAIGIAAAILLCVFLVLGLTIWLAWHLLPHDEIPQPPPRGEGESFVEVPCWFSDGLLQGSDCAWLFPTLQDNDAQTALPVIRLLARSRKPSRRATVYLSGGPGGNSYLYSEGVDFWREWMQRLELNHDLLIYDQRGTGYALPALPCEPVDRVSRTLLDSGLDVDAQWAALEPAMLECAAQVHADDRRRGLYSTATAAQDLRELVQALRQHWGYDEIAIYGVSYGSRLAVEALAEPLPGVTGVVLDSYYPAGVDLTLAFPASFALQVEGFEANCRSMDDCSLGEESLRSLLAKALQSAAQKPPRILADDYFGGETLAVLIDPPTLMSIVEHALYADLGAAELPDRLREFSAGELGDAWRELSSDWLTAMFDPEFSLLAHLLIECRDTPPSSAELERATLAPHPDWAEALRSPSQSFALCERMGVPRNPLTQRSPNLPTLLIAAEFDPRTPADIALREARSFPQLSTLVLPIAGHSVVDFDDCAALAAGAFLNRGVLPAADQCGVSPVTGQTTASHALP